MRLGKTPFEVMDGFETFDRNTVGGNNGNLIFGAASHKLFSTHDTTVDANYYTINRKLADRVNAEYDGFILPLANAFRPSFERELLLTAEFIERLKVPFLMLSGGTQLPLDGNPESLKAMEGTVKRFASAVLEKSSALTVRGEISAQYFKSLGFSQVEVIGCPSMTMNGRGHTVDPARELGADASIAYNIETSHPLGGDLVADAEANYGATYFPQDRATLEMLLWGSDKYQAVDERLPLEKSHPQFQQALAAYHLDAPTWIRYMAEMDFSFGSRIHGNIAAILGGTPAVLLVHDGRTLELAQYHEIPFVDPAAAGCPSTVADLYELADFTGFNRGHTQRFDKLSDFIHENGFTHIYDPGQEDARNAYERRLESIVFPPPQKPVWLDKPPETIRMMAILQQRHEKLKRAEKRLDKRITAFQTRSGSQMDDLTKRIEKAEAQLGEAKTSLIAESHRGAAAGQVADKVRRLPGAFKRALTGLKRAGE